MSFLGIGGISGIGLAGIGGIGGVGIPGISPLSAVEIGLITGGVGGRQYERRRSYDGCHGNGLFLAALLANSGSCCGPCGPFYGGATNLLLTGLAYGGGRY